MTKIKKIILVSAMFSSIFVWADSIVHPTCLVRSRDFDAIIKACLPIVIARAQSELDYSASGKREWENIRVAGSASRFNKHVKEVLENKGYHVLFLTECDPTQALCDESNAIVDKSAHGRQEKSQLIELPTPAQDFDGEILPLRLTGEFVAHFKTDPPWCTRIFSLRPTLSVYHGTQTTVLSGNSEKKHYLTEFSTEEIELHFKNELLELPDCKIAP